MATGARLVLIPFDRIKANSRTSCHIRHHTVNAAKNAKSSISKACDKACCKHKVHSQPQQFPNGGELELHIIANNVGVYPKPPDEIINDNDATTAMTITPPTPNIISPPNFTCLLHGTLNEFCLYSGQEQSQWLIDIAHDICDPTMKWGILQVQDMEGTWRDVNPTDPLCTSIYLYRVQAVVSLTKISKCVQTSTTSSSGSHSTMQSHVMQRDGQQCWVTRATSQVRNSHVCPKQMGDHLLHFIYRSFVSSHLPPALSILDEMCGITLNMNLDDWFDKYELGLRLVAPVQNLSFLSSTDNH